MINTQPRLDTTMEKDFPPINGTDYIELYVGNAMQNSFYYRTASGFSLVTSTGKHQRSKPKPRLTAWERIQFRKKGQ